MCKGKIMAVSTNHLWSEMALSLAWYGQYRRDQPQRQALPRHPIQKVQKSGQRSCSKISSSILVTEAHQMRRPLCSWQTSPVSKLLLCSTLLCCLCKTLFINARKETLIIVSARIYLWREAILSRIWSEQYHHEHALLWNPMQSKQKSNQKKLKTCTSIFVAEHRCTHCPANMPARKA